MKRVHPPSAVASLLWLALIYVLFAWFVSHSPALNRLRWDVTRDRLFSLDPGTRRILERIEEPIQLRLFFSPEIAERYPALRAYKERVDKLLGEMQLYSHGRLQIRWLRPTPFSREEDLAFAHGLRPVPGTEPGKALFFGISGTNGLDGLETLPFLSPEQEPFLEYRLARLIYRLLDNSPRQVALVSQLPDDTLWNRQDAFGMGVALYPLQHDIQTRRLSLPLNDISPETDLLLLLHPPPLDAVSVQAIGKYLAGGGKMAVFVDPLLITPAPLTLAVQSDVAGLEKILGFTLANGQVLIDPQLSADSDLIRNEDKGSSDLATETTPPVLLTLHGQAIYREDILTRDLRRLNLVAAGALVPEKSRNENAQLRVLWQSSGAARLVGRQNLTRLDSVASQEQSDKSPAGSGTEVTGYPLAVRVTPAVTAADQGDHGRQKTATGNKQPQVVPGGVVLVADTDWLLNHAWTRRSVDESGQSVYLAFADNGKFFQNLVDHLSSSPDLIAIPPRHHADRPFTRVIRLRQRSEKKFHQTEQRLINQLRETERVLNQWQQNKDPQDKLILTPEQQQELQRFRQIKLDIREKLRAVRRDFDQDVASLGRIVLGFNLALVPVLLALTGLLSWRWRRHHRRKAAKQGPGRRSHASVLE